MTILDEIAEKTRERVAFRKQEKSLAEIKAAAEAMARAENMESANGKAFTETMAKKTNRNFPFEQALAGEGLSLICEVKKASPSKGLIAEDFPYVQIAKDYEAGGAAAISVLTEPYWFKGEDRYLQEIKAAVSLPVLRKDFIVDEYMIYEAKLLGADAVLLICAILTDAELKAYGELADSLGLTALFEAHDAEEVHRALAAGARLIGVNNRDLKTFTVDIQNSLRYRELVPPDVLFISESGIRTKQDLIALKEHRVDGVLIGETMMRAADRIQAVRDFIET